MYAITMVNVCSTYRLLMESYFAKTQYYRHSTCYNASIVRQTSLLLSIKQTRYFNLKLVISSLIDQFTCFSSKKKPSKMSITKILNLLCFAVCFIAVTARTGIVLHYNYCSHIMNKYFFFLNFRAITRQSRCLLFINMGCISP